LPSALAGQRDEWLNLLETLDGKIVTVEQWLTAAAGSNERVMQLQTHPGIGLITSLALVHTLEPVTRFQTARKVVAYVGLDPVEHSSAEKKRYGSISKEGCRFLRFLLVETAQKAVNGDQELRAFYYRLLQRKERARARVAAARKVLTRGYIMLRAVLITRSSSAGASKRGLPVLQHRLSCLGLVIGRPASPACEESANQTSWAL
jgi:transposase